MYDLDVVRAVEVEEKKAFGKQFLSCIARCLLSETL